MLPDTTLLTMQRDMAAQMVDGIHRYLMNALSGSVALRAQYWKRDFTSPEAYADSVASNRTRFARLIGVVDEREPVAMELMGTTAEPALLAEGPGYRVFAVRWPVLAGVYGEGLLLEPEAPPVASVVAMPDCDQPPERIAGLLPGAPETAQYARRLAENGCRVIVPVLIDRKNAFSGDPAVAMTDQPHREFIYRPAFQMGRHIIGYEVQKVLACVDWFRAQTGAPVGVIGYGEGGLIAFYAAALDTRIQTVVVSGYFQPREEVWREPIYRNVWGLLREFGDAEIASLIAPRTLIIETSQHPEVPASSETSRRCAAPGQIETPKPELVEKEAERARGLVAGLDPAPVIRVLHPKNGLPGQESALQALLDGLGVRGSLEPAKVSPRPLQKNYEIEARMQRQVGQLVEHTQRLVRESPRRRQTFWAKADASSVEAWQESTRWYRDYFWDEVIGRLPKPAMPMNPRTRLFCDEPAYRGYEVALDVYPGVFAYGILLVPKDIAEGERRPVVVCQHGLEGRAQDVADPAINDEVYYHQFGCRLAEQGFVVYAPQNPYIGGDAFRMLQRKANPLKWSLFAFIVRQHERTLDWFAQQPFVDPARIAFYGLSYGGKTAMRVPALLDGYRLSICSGDFNEWIWKTALTTSPYSYLYHGEYEMFEFDLGNTFNYAELSWLICPRPFMVERGHDDGVAPDEWVAYEYARTRRHYDRLGIGDRTTIEFFNGPHTIHGVGAFDFLHRCLNWPEEASELP
jgi:dienelactone hydrolase